MRREDAFPSKYLSKSDLPSPPGSMMATIDCVVAEDVNNDEGGKSPKAVMYFKLPRDTKPLIINSGNWTTLEEAYGEESDDWGGQVIDLFVDPKVQFKGKQVGGIRLRARQNGATANDETWDKDRATMQLATVGLTWDNLVATLKGLGRKSYNAKRDTQVVQDLIQSRMDAGPDEIDEDEIPF